MPNINQTQTSLKGLTGFIVLLSSMLGSTLGIWLFSTHYWNEFLSPWWEGRVQNRYVQTQAVVSKTFPKHYDRTSGKYSQPGMKGYMAMVRYTYEIDGRIYTGEYSARNFYQGKAAEAQAFLDVNIPAGMSLNVLRHPYKPGISVARHEDLPTLAAGLGMGLFSVIPIAAFAIILGYTMYVAFITLARRKQRKG